MKTERVLERLLAMERLLEHMEQRQTRLHLQNAVKEWLLASRSVIDSVIDTLEDEQRQRPAAARKISITKE